ncbi:MAG: OpgC domain-containing protein, partial [Chloroflexota bacterium]
MATLRGIANWQPEASLTEALRNADPRTWAYAVPGSRDYRLDLIRGFLVIAMVVDHIGGNSWLNSVSGNNAFVVSAAEGFVFISGMLMGIVYGKKALRQGVLVGVKAVLSRAWFLYLVTTGLTLASIGLALFTQVPMFYDRVAGLGVWTPEEAVVGALTLHYAYNGTDVLAVYVQLAAIGGLVLYLLATGRTALVLAGSWLLWVAYQWYPAETEFWPIRNSIFPFAAWQLLFYNGMALGFHREAVAKRLAFLRGNLALFGLAAVTATLILVVRLYDTGEWATLGLPAIDAAH